MELILLGGALAAVGWIMSYKKEFTPLPEIMILLGFVVLMVGVMGG